MTSLKGNQIDLDKVFAPIGIHTLNRYDHFVRCVESLGNNSIAKYCDLYISLDYPPSSKYYEGYSKIKAYLDAGVKGFKNVFIYIQEENLGARKNSLFINAQMRKVSDRFIKTEDDNIFSENFLEYMNRCLHYFESDPKIIQITGFSQPVNWSNDYPLQILPNEYNAWGYASWFKKFDDASKYITEGRLEIALNHKRSVMKILRSRPDFLPEIIRYKTGRNTPLTYEGKLCPIDIAMTMYIILNEMKTIMPTLTKVNNMGHDGSGIGCSTSDYKQQSLDLAKSWHCDTSMISDNSKENGKIIRSYFINKKLENMKDRYKKKFTR